MKLRKYVSVSAGMLLACPGMSYGHGFRLPDQDAQATARGEAFAATANNPSAIYYNPAGITQLRGHNVRAGVFGIALESTYENASGEDFDTTDKLHPVPNLFYTFSPEKFPLAFGLGAYSPYGLGTEWPEDTGFRSIALKSEMTYMTLNPVVAWRVLTNLSIAAGPQFNYSEIKLTRGATPYPFNDRSLLRGDATSYSFNAGVLWQPTKQWSFGAAYRSETEMDYEGHTKVSFKVPPPGYPEFIDMAAEASLPFPQSVVLGVSFRPTEKWNLEFNVDWTDWDRVNTVNIHQAIPSALVLNWESSLYYEFGLTRYFENGWHVSGGYIFNENSVPDATFNPLVPDLDRHFVSAGVGYQGSHFSVDLAYQFGFSEERTVRGSAISDVGQSADGKYGYLSHAFALSLGWRF
jgi:long-chain fatty acid transport protein